MKIPANIADRDALYNEVSNACLVSRNDRVAMYERLRCYYLWGCNTDSNPATFNKILPQIDLLVSFLFAAETTKFGIVVDENAHKDQEIIKVPALTRRLHSKWADSHADMQAGQSITWSLVYGTMLMKLIQQGRNTIPFVVDPGSFGVLREDMPFIDDQDAFVHVYTMSYKSLDRMLAAHPKKNVIMSTVSTSMRTPDYQLPASVQRIVMSQFPMTTTGAAGPGQVYSPNNLIDGYRAKVTDERVELRELWIWDDDKDDYRIVTQASGNVTIYDRPNSEEGGKNIFYLPGEHPFVQFCPNPTYDYFWGQSEVDRLTQLQDAREIRMNQISELLNRQVKPPTSLRGMWSGIPDETNYAAQIFGANMSSTDPTAEIKTFSPTVPQDTFAEIREYDIMFNEMTGLSNVTQGKGESGVRSKGHAAELARLGSARIKKRAFTIEDSLDKCGTIYLKLMQQHDPTPMRDEKGNLFTAKQFTGEAAVKVDGHSSSPIFAEDHLTLANLLLEAHAIDRAEYIEMTDPPGKQVMLERLKNIEKNEAAAAKAQQEAEIAGKGLKAVK